MGTMVPIHRCQKRYNRQTVRRMLDEAAARIHIDARLVLVEAELGGDEQMIECARGVLQHALILSERRAPGSPTGVQKEKDV